MSEKKLKTLDIAYIGMFVALMAICSWISIPTPWGISFTLQTFAVFAAIAVLGLGRGFLAVLVYIIIGAVGVPVFAGFSGGFGALMGTTGGYIIGFLASAVVTGLVLKFGGKKVYMMAIAMLLGLVVCYAFGTVWFMVVYARTNAAVGLMTALSWCVFPYVIWDVLKIALAILLEKRVGRFIR
ncbi:MAG: biotin transporter BioY [Lachnospiraceae bacterium]